MPEPARREVPHIRRSMVPHTSTGCSEPKPRPRGPYERYTSEGELDLKGRLQDGQPCGVWLEGDAQVTYPRCGYDS